jgi:hypothetical protein
MENLLKKILKEKKNQELIKLNAVEIVNSLFSELQDRERDILSRRFALKEKDYQTLEEIGKLHKLTRERVRQIQRSSLIKIKKIDEFDKNLESIRDLVSELIDEHGGVMEKSFLLDILSVFAFKVGFKNINKDIYKNYLDFVLSELLSDHVEKVDSSDNFSSFFKIKGKTVDYLEKLLEELNAKIKDVKKTLHFEDLASILKSLESFVSHKDKNVREKSDLDLKDIFKDEVFPEWADIINKNKALYSIMQASKDFDANKFGYWGSKDSPEIRPKRIADKIYLVLNNEEKPMHFSEITEKINNVGFDKKKVSSGSVHNELILDDRYILVDRGVYGLKNWKS